MSWLLIVLVNDTNVVSVNVKTLFTITHTYNVICFTLIDGIESRPLFSIEIIEREERLFSNYFTHVVTDMQQVDIL